MNGKTHVGMAAVAYITICDKIPCKFSYASISVLMVASLLPDIDHPHSLINKYILIIKNQTARVTLYFCLGAAILWYNITGNNIPIVNILGLSLIAIGLSTHRNGFTHSLTGLAVFSSIVGYIGNKYHTGNIIYWFMLGYSFHLICDMTTKRGVALFYPFIKKKIKFPITYSTNSRCGKLIESGIMIVGMLYIIYKLPYIKF